MYKFHYNYIKNKYGNKSKLLFTDTDSLMCKIKAEDVYEDFSSNKEMFGFSNCSTKTNYCDCSNKLVIGKMQKAKGVNGNVVVTISHKKYKDVLLNKKCWRHSTNRIQSKDHRIRTYEINTILLSCFDDKIYIQNNGYDGSALGYQS